MKRTSAELKRQARETLTHRYGIPIAVMVVAELITTVLLLPFSWGLTEKSPMGDWVIYYVASFVISLVSVILSMGSIYIALQMARGKEYSFKNMFYGFKHHPDKYILATLLLTLICLIPMIPFALVYVLIWFTGGMKIIKVLLLILTLILALIGEFYFSMRYALILYLLLDNEKMRVAEAFRVSTGMMRGNKGRLFYINLSFLGWECLAILSFGIGYLWITPYMTQTQVSFYLDVVEQSKRTYTREWSA